ncbi:MAG: ATP-binding protein, partial [Chlamydiae bacterium]|nr:ATP-binding protein [Chlamydiota bacterium]
MSVERDLAKHILSFLHRREFIALLGPRQVGKTTLLEMLRTALIQKMEGKSELVRQVTFEDRRVLDEFERDPTAYVASFFSTPPPLSAYLMVDEFQYAERGGQKLKLIFDTMPWLKIIVTGSSSLDIKAQMGKYMVGRILTFYLYPFNFGEFLRAQDTRLERIYQERNQKILSWLMEGKKIPFQRGEDAFISEMEKYYEEHCVWGGFPAVILSKRKEERWKVLGDIFNNYLLKDIKGLLALATDRDLVNLAQYLAPQIGNLVNHHHLSQACTLEYRKLKKHLTLLQETFISQEIRPFFKNRQKELTKSPKIFFLDLGFRNFLMENMNGFRKRSDAGAMVENRVFIRLRELSEDLRKINFWRTKMGAE